MGCTWLESVCVCVCLYPLLLTLPHPPHPTLPTKGPVQDSADHFVMGVCRTLGPTNAAKHHCPPTTGICLNGKVCKPCNFTTLGTRWFFDMCTGGDCSNLPSTECCCVHICLFKHCTDVVETCCNFCPITLQNLGHMTGSPHIVSDGHVALEYTGGGVCSHTANYSTTVTLICSDSGLLVHMHIVM